MTFSNDGRCVVEKRTYSEDEIEAMIHKSREECKRLRKLGRAMKTVAVHRLKELKHLQARDKLETWRRTYGLDRITGDNNQWAYCPLPPTPEQFTASLWAELNTLKDAVSMSGQDGSWQRAKRFIDELKQGTVSLSDEEFAIIKEFVESRGRDAAHATVAPVDTAQYCSPRSPSSKISSDVCICTEKKEEIRMDSEPDWLESPSAGTGFETAGQQCHRTWETRRTTAARYLTTGVGSNLGETLLHPLNALTRKPIAKSRQRLQHQTPFSCRRAANPKTGRKAAKKTSNLTLVGKEETHRFGRRV